MVEGEGMTIGEGEGDMVVSIIIMTEEGEGDTEGEAGRTMTGMAEEGEDRMIEEGEGKFLKLRCYLCVFFSSFLSFFFFIFSLSLSLSACFCLFSFSHSLAFKSLQPVCSLVSLSPSVSHTQTIVFFVL